MCYEGYALSLSGSAEDPFGATIVSYEWDLDDDGEYDDASGPAPVVPWAQLAGLGLAAGSDYTISLKVTDSLDRFRTSSTGLTLRFQGDANGDHCVNVADILSAREGMGAVGGNLDPDVDVNGRVNVLDIVYIRSRLGSGYCQ